MSKKILTKAMVDGAAPAAKVYRLWDAKVDGLHLRVWPSGGRVWYVQWGRNQARTLGKPPAVGLDLARARALAVLSDAATNGVPSVAKKRTEVPTLRAFITDEYRPWAQQNMKRGDMAANRLESVYRELLDRRIDEIDARVVEAIRTRRLAAERSKSTCNRDLAELKAALARAVIWKILPTHPLVNVKLARLSGTGVVRYLSVAEEKRLRSALKLRDRRARKARENHQAWAAERGYADLEPIPPDGFADHLTPMVIMAMSTGLRRGEQTQLLWSDIDGGIVTARAETTKSGSLRHIPLSPEVRDVLARWRAQTKGEDHERIFPVDDAKKAWAALLDLAQIKDFRWHDLRHHFASRLVMAGVDLNTVRELLGHADIKMTLRYAHLAPEHKAEAIKALATPRKGDGAPAQLPAPAAAADPAAVAVTLIGQITDPKALRALMQQLAERLEA